MDEWTCITTDEEIDAALEAAKLLPPEPHALTGKYVPDLDLILLGLNDGRRLAIPREQLQGLQNATPAQIAHIEIFGGTDICWPELDLDHHLRSLIVGRYGSAKWMESLQAKWQQTLEAQQAAEHETVAA